MNKCNSLAVLAKRSVGGFSSPVKRSVGGFHKPVINYASDGFYVFQYMLHLKFCNIFWNILKNI